MAIMLVDTAFLKAAFSRFCFRKQLPMVVYKRGALNDRGPLMTITLGCTKPSKYWLREKVIGSKVSCLDSLFMLVLFELGWINI